MAPEHAQALDAFLRMTPENQRLWTTIVQHIWHEQSQEAEAPKPRLSIYRIIVNMPDDKITHAIDMYNQGLPVDKITRRLYNGEVCRWQYTSNWSSWRLEKNNNWSASTWGTVEHPEKGSRRRKQTDTQAGSEPINDQQDDILNEVRSFLRTEGNSRVFLSVLGSQLKPSSRDYLRRHIPCGLKKFLQLHSQEFRLEGTNGRITVTWEQ